MAKADFHETHTKPRMKDIKQIINFGHDTDCFLENASKLFSWVTYPGNGLKELVL